MAVAEPVPSVSRRGKSPKQRENGSCVRGMLLQCCESQGQEIPTRHKTQLLKDEATVEMYLLSQLAEKLFCVGQGFPTVHQDKVSSFLSGSATSTSAPSGNGQ